VLPLDCARAPAVRATIETAGVTFIIPERRNNDRSRFFFVGLTNVF
jgi:hypothetical protein